MHGLTNFKFKKRIVRQVGYLQELNWDARSTEHKIMWNNKGNDENELQVFYNHYYSKCSYNMFLFSNQEFIYALNFTSSKTSSNVSDRYLQCNARKCGEQMVSLYRGWLRVLPFEEWLKGTH